MFEETWQASGTQITPFCDDYKRGRLSTAWTAGMLPIVETLCNAVEAFRQGRLSTLNIKNLKDVPALRDARRVHGRGQRGQSVEPLFCPMAVTTWLMDPHRKKGRKFYSEGKPWELLELHFPKVYAKHSVGDPRQA